MAVQVVPHPEFRPENSRSHDLMLLRVDPPFVLSPLVEPLPLPLGPAQSGALCTVMGWGTTTSPTG
ncbi:PREDICTED: snake venom serine proteinase 14-like [Acanthisitta chloris]|uniref:snake venom serine proteinase 14-like n=1 Tax=Acanthisitta chloris TaxID=57068 RepID=UPI0004F0FE37|nr:PREDICTED: snake venom serine proteinase 14-like [Acanthisitta chloris]